MRKALASVLLLLTPLACDSTEDQDHELRAGLEFEGVEPASPQNAIPVPFPFECSDLPVYKCDKFPGCTLDAIGCDFDPCSIDPLSGEPICFPCDPVLVCVSEAPDCNLLSPTECLNYPDQCEIDVFGCDDGPICDLDPFGDIEVCYGCDPVALCTDKQPFDILPLP